MFMPIYIFLIRIKKQKKIYELVSMNNRVDHCLDSEKT